MTPDKGQRGLLGRIAGMKTFRLQLALLIGLYTVIVYGALYVQSQRLAYDSLRNQGASYFELVKHTRAWNAEKGGVWLLKHADVETSPYLIEAGIEADLDAEGGRELTLRNPSAMMAEISRLAKGDSGVWFHLVSDDPLNPENAPDEWEKQCLTELADEGGGYREALVTEDGTHLYRYIEPLVVDSTCVGCHTDHRYTDGAIQGGVTINIPMDQVDGDLRRTAIFLAGMAAITLGLAIGASQWFVSRLQIKLDDANVLVSAMAVTDELTELANRRATLERLTTEFSRAKRGNGHLSVIAIDIDHFKRVNDNHGHGVGDEILRQVATRMRSGTRKYDTLGRIGGEEFLVVAPDADIRMATTIAKRMLETVRSQPYEVGDLVLTITASAGVATMDNHDARADTLVGRADDALYEAKAAGRDQVRPVPRQ